MNDQIEYCKAMRVKPKNFIAEKHEALVHYVQKKEDGHRVMITSDANCHLKFIGRKDDHRERMEGHPLLTHFQNFMPPNTVVDGEMHVEGGTSSDVLTAMIGNDERLCYSAFQVMMLNGEMKTGVTDHYEMEDMIDELEMEVPETILLRDIRQVMAATGGQTLTEYLLDRALNRKIEGFVLKGSANGRAADWFKLKPVKTADLVVMSYKAGKGKHKGKLGALRGGVYNADGELVQIASAGTGYSDDQRLWTEQECLGRVMEVSYQSVGPKGKLIFPRFERFRDNEKQASECGMDQL